MRYRVLVKELSLRELLLPRPHIPFLGYSIEGTINSIQEIRDPKWRSGSPSYRSYYGSHFQSHGCKLTSHIEPVVNHIEHNLKGISLEEFP